MVNQLHHFRRKVLTPLMIAHLTGCEILTHRPIRHFFIYNIVINHFLSMAYNGQNYLELHSGIIVSPQSLNSQQGDYIVSRICHFFSLLVVYPFQGRQIYIKKRNRHRRIGEDNKYNPKKRRKKIHFPSNFLKKKDFSRAFTYSIKSIIKYIYYYIWYSIRVIFLNLST